MIVQLPPPDLHFQSACRSGPDLPYRHYCRGHRYPSGNGLTNSTFVECLAASFPLFLPGNVLGHITRLRHHRVARDCADNGVARASPLPPACAVPVAWVVYVAVEGFLVPSGNGRSRARHTEPVAHRYTNRGCLKPHVTFLFQLCLRHHFEGSLPFRHPSRRIARPDTPCSVPPKFSSKRDRPSGR